MKKPSKKTTGVARRVLPVAGAAEAPQSAGLPTNDQPSDHWVLPAIRAVQARHEYYVVLVKLRELPRRLAPIAKMPLELRVQQALNMARVPRIAAYILGNPNDYTLSSLVGAVDELPRFEPVADKSCTGRLYIPRSMPVTLLDGQHRRAASEQAIREDSAKMGGGLGSETISVVFDLGRLVRRRRVREGTAEVR
ncbi:DNA sulfur modification protein DndB [Sorangium sp. So ce281]|uniref:DNA sulfur modification protein DndB n=1 Tax=unclassified Sorangium TaxID=2621164 RepID=UPI003F6305A1